MKQNSMLFPLAALFMSLISPEVWAQVGQVRVGDTNDGCDADHPVVFQDVIHQGTRGRFSVHAGDFEEFDLPAPVREIEFYCGYTQEFASNSDEPCGIDGAFSGTDMLSGERRAQ